MRRSEGRLARSARRLRRRALPPGRPRRPEHRGDIQALRAIAVVLVVADHLVGSPRGGFLGVDVFFVVSGYVITAQLLRSASAEGPRGAVYADFYRRRVRRLLPMALLVLATTVVATRLVVGPARAVEVGRDALWAAAFGANWHFSLIGTDYFAASSPPSPLQHYWSLSVEEQFYLAWPLLVLGAAAWARRSGRRTTRGVGWLAAAVVLVSWGYSVWHSGAAPVAAYFSTFDRAWELGVGAGLACLPAVLPAFRPWQRAAVCWAGLAVIAVAVVTVGPGTRFPAPGAVAAVVGAALVVLSGHGGRAPGQGWWANRATGYLGDLSYAVYLWHFPVIVLGAAYAPDGGAAYVVGCVLVMLLLAATGHHLVEDPVRRSTWLEPRDRRRSAGPVRPSGALLNGWLAVAVVVVSGLAVVSMRPPAPAGAVEVLASAPSAPNGRQAPRPSDYLQERIGQTLGLRTFPRIDPPVGDLGIGAWLEAARDHGCVTVLAGDLDACRTGSGAKHAVLLGDSFAIAYLPAVQAALGKGWTLQQLTFPECPPFDLATRHFDGREYPECAAFKDFAVGEIAAEQPDLVLVASSFAYVAMAGVLPSRDTGEAAAAQIEPAYAAVLRRVRAASRETVVIGPPPASHDLQQCVTEVGQPSDCVSSPAPGWATFQAAAQGAADAAGAAYLDVEPWFCRDEACPAFVGSTAVYADGLHLTRAYSSQLGPVLRAALSPLLAPAKGARQ